MCDSPQRIGRSDRHAHIFPIAAFASSALRNRATWSGSVSIEPAVAGWPGRSPRAGIGRGGGAVSVTETGQGGDGGDGGTPGGSGGSGGLGLGNGINRGNDGQPG